jgi:hypothetical protein
LNCHSDLIENTDGLTRISLTQADRTVCASMRELFPQLALKTKKKLNALTSLRFFAAALIVLHHSRGRFGFSENLLYPFQPDQAVSFFFVLSGFILVYVYPSLNSWKDKRRFLLTRFVRLWPVHLATWLLANYYQLSRNPEKSLIIFANHKPQKNLPSLRSIAVIYIPPRIENSWDAPTLPNTPVYS